ncbi:hypothetical protein [Lysinibacillus irui]|uniref:hypothetical protein n=1 Tax=Lysinibacillus irui TaxID=2998077 RepID=UPI002AD5825D|nr:hypothetical protein [Lysinibacillus irui]MEA0565047.1 hypothetical protein [Lysinibacillus irui]
MDDLFLIISILSLLAIFIFIIFAIIKFAKKDSVTGKKQVKFAGISVAVMIASFIGFVSTTDSTETSKNKDIEKVETVAKPKEETPEEKATREAKEAEEKAIAEQKAKEEAEARAKAEEEAKAKAEAERLAKLEALKLSGSGDTATKKFKLDSGFLIIDATHQGSRNFAVKLLDSNANSLKLVVNEIGNYSGKKIYSIPAGEYQYEVTASGPWTINMSQDIPKDVSPEGKVSGKGDSVVFMNITKGAKTVSFTHDGSRNFVVKANDSVLLANEIGAYNGSKVQKVEDSSIYFFDITADGNWTMTFE